MHNVMQNLIIMNTIVDLARASKGMKIPLEALRLIMNENGFRGPGGRKYQSSYELRKIIRFSVTSLESNGMTEEAELLERTYLGREKGLCHSQSLS